SFGFALFWKAMLSLPTIKLRFYLAAVWFFCVQLIQLSWMSATEYMGPLILAVYFGLNIALGLQFALFSSFIPKGAPLKASRILALAGLWVFFEWIRLFVCSGFTWNPVGLFLSCSVYSRQMASLFGIYGLSFWVILVNLLALQVMLQPRRKQVVTAFLGLALLPYIAGALYIWRLDTEPKQLLKTLLVQTALLPEQKDFDPNRSTAFIPLAEQWSRVLHLVEEKLKDQTADLIILPEGALPYGAYYYPYDIKVFKGVWENYFGAESLSRLPKLEKPMAFSRNNRWKVTNAYWAQAMADHFKADVIVGLDDERHNAAFLFRPNQKIPQRCEKQILVPISEYIPFGGLKCLSSFVAERFGITQSFFAGSKTKVMTAKVPLSISICYEETYGDLCRLGRLQGAELFVNLSNDAWFPSSLLAQQHSDHGIIRSVENGVSVLRSCNTGITCGVDRFGRMVKQLQPSEKKADALFFELSADAHSTLYTLWGDKAILSLSALFLGLFLFQKKKKTLP
ncbi:MAG: apolipoprotein N-acyltransferase, partial [Chlamydiae bacterium]|nr:apolipoprotein N-acyltransferase [Chlamydiota bacterium]